VLVDAYGEGEELGAWVVALGERIRPALSATVMGIPVELIGVEAPEWGGGLRAQVRREGRPWTVALADVSIDASASTEFGRTLAAYRKVPFSFCIREGPKRASKRLPIPNFHENPHWPHGGPS